VHGFFNDYINRSIQCSRQENKETVNGSSSECNGCLFPKLLFAHGPETECRFFACCRCMMHPWTVTYLSFSFALRYLWLSMSSSDHLYFGIPARLIWLFAVASMFPARFTLFVDMPWDRGSTGLSSVFIFNSGELIVQHVDSTSTNNPN